MISDFVQIMGASAAIVIALIYLINRVTLGRWTFWG